MNYNLKKITEAGISGKTVLLRADLDVPLQNGKIKDTLRLEASLETIRYIKEKAKELIIVGHLGRPQGEDKAFSLEPVAKWYSEKFNFDIQAIEKSEFRGWKISENIVLLENLRFEKGEEENDEDFAKRLSKLADIYVNDAFASSHRAHASISGVSKLLPHFAGLRLSKEVEELTKVLENPKRPLTVIIGGAKIETKLPLVEKMHSFADFVLVGGELSEQDKVLLRVMHGKVDRIKSILLVADLEESKKEITEYSSENFIQVINKSQTVVWNGPMGLIEKQEFSKESKEIAKAISESECYSIVGGGDTIAFLNSEGLLSKFSFVSMGGGAMLEFLSGEKLPGIEALL